MQMRVGLDITTLRTPHAGIAVYTIQLIQALLPRLQAEEALDYFDGLDFGHLDAGFVGAALARNDAGGPAVGGALVRRGATGLALEAARRVMRVVPALRAPARRVKQMAFERGARDRGWDLFHALVTMPPGRTTCPTIPLVYDMSLTRHPEHHPRERVRSWERWLPAIAAAPVINTISLFSRQEIADLLGYPPARIVVTYPGVDPYFHGADPAGEAAALEGLGLRPRGYFLAVGTLEPRKNLATLIAAYAGLPEAVQAALPLVVVGQPGWGALNLPPETERLRAAGRLRFTGYIPRATLRALYRQAVLFLFPSVYEGFGIPAAEALACGTPAAVSRDTSMEEVIGPEGVAVQALDVGGWRNAMLAAAGLAGEPDAGAAERRRARARLFDWGAAAEGTLAMYRATLGNEPLPPVPELG